MSRRRYNAPPPEDAEYMCGEVIEVISEEEKAGRPVAPPIELTPYDPTARPDAGGGDDPPQPSPSK